MKALVILTLSLVSATAFALPRAPHDALQVKMKSLPVVDLAYDFEGIVKLSNCSGSLVTFAGLPDTAKGIVMTNGHCIQKPGGYLNPGEVWVNRPIKRKMQIFNSKMKLAPINATKILYATMTNTDVAFYELEETYEEIASIFKVRPFMMDGNHPVAGLSIDIISGYWDRGYSCDVDGFVFKLKEGDWSWSDSIRYTAGCDTIGGTSGSPIIQRDTRTVVGINNTHNEKGERCTLDNPCEEDENGNITVMSDVRYGQQTFNIYTCLSPDFQIDLSRRGCTLPQ